jgi:hypothetical protein
MSDGILHIDGFAWSMVKYSTATLKALTPQLQADRIQAESETFARYHESMAEWIEAGGGKVWNTIGDCTIANGFNSVDDAVATATSIQRRLTDFNLVENRLGTALLVRIGVSEGSLPDLPVEKRGEASLPELDLAAHLQKACPPGRVRIARDVYERLRFSRQDFRPALSFEAKPSTEGSMVWVDRMLTPQDIEGIKSLSPRQARSFPPIALTRDDFDRLGRLGDLRDVRDLLSNSLAILGETRSGREIKKAVNHPAATSDAVGAIEVFAAIASSHDVFAAIDEWDDTVDIAAQGDIVIVGSPAVNLFAFAVNRVLRGGFEESTDRPMRIRVDSRESTLRFPASYHHGDDDTHYGLVLIDRNPINPEHRLLWIGGLTGMATQAASRLAKDLASQPKSVFPDEDNFPTAVVVRPHWKDGYDSAQYQGRWRVSGYEIVWSGRHNL